MQVRNYYEKAAREFLFRPSSSSFSWRQQHPYVTNVCHSKPLTLLILAGGGCGAGCAGVGVDCAEGCD